MFESGHAAAETEVVVDGPELLLGDADMRAVLIVRVVAVGNQCVESIVAAGQFEDDQDLSVVLSLSRERGVRLGEQRERKSARR